MPRGSLTTNLAKSVNHGVSETLSYKIKWRTTEEDSQHQPLAYAPIGTHIYTIYKEKEKGRKEGRIGERKEERKGKGSETQGLS